MTADWIYENRVPFGLLTEAERAQLRAHPGPWEYYCYRWETFTSSPWDPMGVYRAARPQPQHAQPPWDILDQSIVAVFGYPKSGRWLAGTAIPEDAGIEWLWSKSAPARDISFLIFPRGNMPWNESLVLRPGYEVGK
jgi:hypothetical protein